MKSGASALAVLLMASATLVVGQTTTQTPVRRPDVIWLPSDDAVVTAMLKLAEVTKNDVVYDLGCGDGRIVIAAARQFGARGVGIDIDPERIKEAKAAALKAGVSSKVTFILGDLFDPQTKFGDATVVTLFLLPSLNAKLRPRLQNELKPGTRVISNAFSMGDAWPPERTEQIGDSVIYRWTISGKTGLEPPKKIHLRDVDRLASLR